MKSITSFFTSVMVVDCVVTPVIRKAERNYPLTSAILCACFPIYGAFFVSLSALGIMPITLTLFVFFCYGLPRPVFSKSGQTGFTGPVPRSPKTWSNVQRYA